MLVYRGVLCRRESCYGVYRLFVNESAAMVGGCPVEGFVSVS